jgi:siroheme synthase
MKSIKKIAIVGTGPGHPDYLTAKALKYLKQADIILYDCLIDEIIFSMIPDLSRIERVEKEYTLKNDIELFDQNILKKMMKYADQGLRVVRIKPGDAMNYNSGGMETDYLESKGYQVELIPGIPAHFAAANQFKINLTEIEQSNGCQISLIADDISKENNVIPHIASLMKHSGVALCIYGMRPELFDKLKLLLTENEADHKIPVAICGDISLKSEVLIKTNIGEMVDLVQVLINEEKLPSHYLVIIGKHILESYVDFKNQTAKA